jgi:hypothetical protein
MGDKRSAQSAERRLLGARLGSNFMVLARV